MTANERKAIEEAQQAARSVREWRRFQADYLLADGREACEMAAVQCSNIASVYYWVG